MRSVVETWRYRELIYFLAWRDVKVKYKQAVLGAAWAIIQPLFSMVVFTLLFGRLAHIPSDEIPYPLFAYLGLVLWTYVSNVSVQASQSLVSNANLITKVFFPRISLPLSVALSGLLDFAIGLLFLIFLIAYFGIRPGFAIIVAPLFIGELVLLTLGISLLLAAMNVWYRDIKHVLPLLIQLWMFATPVIYPMSFIPERLRWMVALNPLAGIMDGFRHCVALGAWPSVAATAWSLIATVVLFIVGVVYFQKTERLFADMV